MATHLPHLLILAGLIGSMSGCGAKGGQAGDDTGAGSTGGASSGAIEIRIEMDPDLITSMDEPASGVFLGQIFNAEQVTAIGPEDGAAVLDEFSAEVDLGDGQYASGIVHSSVEFSVPAVVVLGFLDSDGNAAATDGDPDGGDPVTLPGPNTFEVVFGQATAVTVELGLLYPGR